MSLSNQRAKLIGKIRLAKFMELSEEIFGRFVKEIENNLLFIELHFKKEFEQISLWDVRLRTARQLPQRVIAILDDNGVCFVSDYYKGRYCLDRVKIKELKKNRFFNPEKADELQALQRKIRLINSRRSILYEILRGIVAYQKDYLQSGRTEDLKPLSQLKLAQLSGINHSLISRILDSQLVQTKQGNILPLKFFFASRHIIWNARICKLLIEEKFPLSDREVKNRLDAKYGHSIARRTVNKYRKILLH